MIIQNSFFLIIDFIQGNLLSGILKVSFLHGKSIEYIIYTLLYIRRSVAFVKMKSITSPQLQQTTVAHDTLQELSYAKRPAFNALWQPKDIVSIEVKAIEKRRILGDKDLENIIK
jgi:hypothetical protein